MPFTHSLNRGASLICKSPITMVNVDYFCQFTTFSIVTHSKEAHWLFEEFEENFKICHYFSKIFEEHLQMNFKERRCCPINPTRCPHSRSNPWRCYPNHPIQNQGVKSSQSVAQFSSLKEECVVHQSKALRTFKFNPDSNIVCRYKSLNYVV